MGLKIEHKVGKSENVKEGNEFSKLLQTEISFSKSFNNKKKEAFYSELSVLLKAGIHLKESLSLMLENQTKEKMKIFYTNLVTELVEGKSFSEILFHHKDFSEYEYYSLKIGEETGTLSRITTELARFFADKNEQRRNLVNAMTYPIIILCTAIIVVVFMLRMVVPMFEDIFKQNGVELPEITKIIIAASNFIKNYGWLFLFLLFVPLGLRKVFKTYKHINRGKDYLLLKIPYLGGFLKAVYLAQFTQAVALLTTAKVPMLSSLQMVNKMIAFCPLQDALSSIEEEVLQGKSLHQALKGKKIFDNRMVSLIKVAEETNQTEFIFQKLNQQYTLEVAQKSKMLSTMMEPLIILVIGVFVGIILVSMYLPMFKLSTVLG